MPKLKPANAPIDAKTDAQIANLGRDNVSYGNFWMILDGSTIRITDQPMGASPVQNLTISRRAFDRFARWYVTGSQKRPK